MFDKQILFFVWTIRSDLSTIHEYVLSLLIFLVDPALISIRFLILGTSVFITWNLAKLHKFPSFVVHRFYARTKPTLPLYSYYKSFIPV